MEPDRYAAAARAWPAITRLDRARFEKFAAAKPETADPAELYLACAAGLGDPAAVAELEERIARVVRRARLAADPDEVRQAVSVRLLVGDAPRVLEFSGTGSFDAWLSLVCVRTALNLSRGAAEAAHEGLELAEVAVAATELDPVVRLAGDQLKPILQASFAALTPRERNLLRLRYVDGLTLEAVAAAYGTHRTTAVRWLADAKASLSAEMRRLGAERLGLPAAQLDSLVGQVQSGLDLSLDRVL